MNDELPHLTFQNLRRSPCQKCHKEIVVDRISAVPVT
jgi:hypothetical protein